MKIPHIRRAGRPIGRPAPSPALKVTPLHAFGAGYTDVDTEALAREEAKASFYDEDVHGPNRAVRSAHLLVEAHDVQAALIGHDLRERLDEPEAVLERETPRYRQLEQDELQAVQQLERAEDAHALLEDEIIAEGLTIPEPRAHRALALRLLAYGLGDLIFIAVAFQVFGISDKEIIPGLPLTELQLAASTSVFALLYLAHAAGSALRDLHHQITKPAEVRP